jgi:hypothetical protein
VPVDVGLMAKGCEKSFSARDFKMLSDAEESAKNPYTCDIIGKSLFATTIVKDT